MPPSRGSRESLAVTRQRSGLCTRTARAGARCGRSLAPRQGSRTSTSGIPRSSCTSPAQEHRCPPRSRCAPRCWNPSERWTASPQTAATRRGWRCASGTAELVASIAAYDLLSVSPVDQVGFVAARLADAAGAALEASLCVARTRVSGGGAGAGLFPRAQVAGARLAVIGMGKTGARELNYVSDVDVIFVAGADDALIEEVGESRIVDITTRLAVQTMRGISGVEIEPPLWEVDANLRPEGKQGALVRTLDSHLSYYDRWAKSWEFQALLKARPIAGDAALGEAYVSAVQPKIWTSAARENFVDSVQRMRERVTEHIPSGDVALPDQARSGRHPGYRVHGSAAPARPRALRRPHPPARHPRRPERARRAGLHRPHRGRGVLPRLPGAAPPRASRAAAQPAKDASDAVPAGGPPRARSLVGDRGLRREGLADLGDRQARSARHPRPTVLPAAPFGCRIAAGGGAIALTRAGPRSARRDRLHGSGRRTPAHRGTHQRTEPRRDHPTAPHARDDPLVRRRRRPRLRTALVPADQRAPRRHALVPADAPGLVRCGRESDARPVELPLRRRAHGVDPGVGRVAR